MKRFRFPLHSVATLRSWRESEARERFAVAIHALDDAERALAAVRQRVAELETVLRAGRLAVFRPAEHAAFLAAYHNELGAAGRAEQVQQEARAAADRAREAWQTARAEMRAVEQLEQRARRLHRLEQERAEQVALDEIASIRATRPTPHAGSL